MSSFSAILPNFQTRSWRDTNSDGARTTLRIDYCRQDGGNAFGAMTWDLRRERDLLPDPNIGNRNIDCRGRSGSNSWARSLVPEGNYHHTYVGVTSGQSSYMSSNYLRVSY